MLITIDQLTGVILCEPLGSYTIVDPDDGYMFPIGEDEEFVIGTKRKV